MKKRNHKQHSIKFSIIASTTSIIIILSFITFITTYLNFYHNVNETVDVQTKEISHQIVYNYENYFETIINTSNMIQVDLTNQQIEDERILVSDYLNRIVQLKNEIIRIDVYDTIGYQLASSIKDDDQDLYLDLDEPWFKWAINDSTIHHFSIPYKVDGQYRLTISKLINYNRNSDTGVLRIEINFDHLINLANNANLGKGGFISIIDADYNPIYSSKSSQLIFSDQDEQEVLKTIILGSKHTRVSQYEMMIHVNTLENTRWRICVFSNIDQLMAIRSYFLRNIILISLVSIFLASIILLGVSKRITSPLKQLERVMRKIDKSEEFAIEMVDIKANNREVANLTSGFNHMMKRIKELMDKIVIEQREQRKSELKALQNQINPHFLYNTLDSITWLIEMNKNEQATEMVIALAKFFRISISRGRNIITIKDELEHARNYLLIQSYRYQDSFHYEFNIDETLLDYPILKLVLQPLIENALYHGMKHKIDVGQITIGVEEIEGFIHLSVSDNGLGIRPEKIASLYENFQNPHLKNGVGLKNIYQRLILYYGQEASIHIESELDEGTKISIIIPKRREVHDHP